MDDTNGSSQDFVNMDDVVLECLVSPSPVGSLPWLECSLNKSHSLSANRDVNANKSYETFRTALKKANGRRKLIEAGRASRNREFSEAFQALGEEISHTCASDTIATEKRGPPPDQSCSPARVIGSKHYDYGPGIANPPLFERENHELVPSQSGTFGGDLNMNCLDQTPKIASAMVAPKALFEKHPQNYAISNNDESFEHEFSAPSKIGPPAESISARNVRDRIDKTQNSPSIIAPKVLKDSFENGGRKDHIPKTDASFAQMITDASMTGPLSESIGATSIPNCLDQVAGVIAPKASNALFKDNGRNDIFLTNGASFAQRTAVSTKFHSAQCNGAAITPTCAVNRTYVCKPVKETDHEPRMDTPPTTSEVPTDISPGSTTHSHTAVSNHLSTRDHGASKYPNTAAGCTSNEPNRPLKSPVKESGYFSTIRDPSFNIVMDIRAPDDAQLRSSSNKENSRIPQSESSCAYGGKMTTGTSNECQRGDTNTIHPTQKEFAKVKIRVESIKSIASAIPRSRQHSVLSTYDSFAVNIADNQSHHSTPQKSPRANTAAPENALVGKPAGNNTVPSQHHQPTIGLAESELTIIAKEASLIQHCGIAGEKIYNRGATFSETIDSVHKTEAPRIENKLDVPGKENERPFNVAITQSEAAAAADYKGPKLYKEFTFKTNKHIINNAICHSCLSGKVNENIRSSVVATLEASECRHFMILFRDSQCKYRALYSYDLETDKLSKLIGNGPNAIAPAAIDCMFKYNSGRKAFTKLSSKTLSLSIDAVAIKNVLWQTVKRGNVVRR